MQTSSNDLTVAVNRFGLGAKPGELASVHDPRAWLNAQIAHGSDDGNAFAGLPGSLDYLRDEARLVATRRVFKQGDRGRRAYMFGAVPPATGNGQANAAELKRALEPYRREERKDLLAEAAARYRVATVTDTPFVERLVHFWSNHFAVSVDKRPARLFAAPMEREAIRPHVAGRFADMLLAVETHPAMLLYLDNVRSVGPDSRLGRRIAMRLARKGDRDKGSAGGLNENLGREAMELHTVGVDGGYTQADVTEFSRALTGWSIPFPRDFANDRQPDSAFAFRANAHEPGARRVMGRTFPEEGFEQGKAILEFLARQPATAKHLSLKLAQHFVSDDPPRSLVDRLVKSYLQHDTDLAAVYRTLIASPEAWEPDARKFRTPQDFVIAALRAGQIELDDNPQPALALLANLGEPVFDPRSPAGFTDDSANWVDPDALWKRVQAAEALSARVAQGDPPLAWARDVLGPRLDDDTAQAIRRAESTRQAHATLFACPAFQWRA
ncbi:MAG: DUF1800 domain-containing protein [Xanthomonadales bacterium]|nr:DUF1800 domain-containing protein [Xanthomonadales bacterium]ODU93089.1 MAG: hypothetical protein ABT18_10035 [Rhodanobacter sp. SCN 66-43]OJY83742.1 MAG: hypothetical protein BGP23_13975 [Xanthomonadales bacterium 66-474]